MEAYEAMVIRRWAMSHLQHAIACIYQDDMDAVWVLHNCKQLLEMMDSAERLKYQQMLEALSIPAPIPLTRRKYLVCPRNHCTSWNWNTKPSGQDRANFR